MTEMGRNQWSHTAAINMTQAAIHSAKKSTPKPEDYNPWLEARSNSNVAAHGFAALKAAFDGVNRK